MIGLRGHERDPSLLEKAGERVLRVPSDAEVQALVARHLVRPGAAAPVAAALEYARWKPGVSLTTSHAVLFADGGQALVTVRAYAGGKAAALRANLPERLDLDTENGDPRLTSCADAGRDRFLYVFPCDRLLPGAARLGDRKRTARLLNALPFDAGARVRWRRSSVELLRYRPERRAVFRLELALSDPLERWNEARVAARVLPPALVPALLAARTACFAGARAALAPGLADECHRGEIAPGLLGGEARTGIVFERWLDVEVSAPDDFRDAAAAGALLARLHGAPSFAAPQGATELAEQARDPAAERPELGLFSVDRELAAAARDLARRLFERELPAEPSVWIHGDFHPDQVARARDGSGGRLLDLDLLQRGPASGDLASWVADHVAVRPELAARAALEPLLAGYLAAGGVAPEPAALAVRIARALFARAAASLRRLEHSAPAKAAALLARARDTAERPEELA